MKKTLIICIVVASALWGDWIRLAGSDNSPESPKIEVMRTDSTGLFIRNMFTGFNKADTTIDNKNFQRIEIPDAMVSQDVQQAGRPQIPYVRLLIAVPDSCEFAIQAYQSENTSFEDYLLYPIPQVVPEESAGLFYVKEVYAYDTLFYQKDTVIPNKFYEIKDDGYWRDQRVLEVHLYPIQYNPQQKIMHFYYGLDIRIDYVGNAYPNTHGLGPFEDMGREILINYPGVEYQSGPPSVPTVHYYTNLTDPENIADYIIVTHNDFLVNETTSQWIHDFAQWRVEHNQFDVGIVKVQDIYEQFPDSAPDEAAQLRQFLRYAYRNWQSNAIPDGHYAYCLFIGDWDYVPTELFTYYITADMWLGVQEYYFANLNLSGLMEIMLGRWPVKESKAQDLATIVQKTINYEKYPTVGDWRRVGLLIAGDGIEFDPFISNCKPYLSDICYDTMVVRYSQINDPETFAQQIQTNFESGTFLTVYNDHGGPEAWWHNYDTTYVKILQNGARLPVILSCACLTAMFQWDNPFYDEHFPNNYPSNDSSIAEVFLVNPNGGAVAFFGATTFVSYVSDNMLETLHQLFHCQNWTLGKFLFSGLAIGETMLIPAETCYTYCLLGDPALDLGDYSAYPNLPDLVVRQRALDIAFDKPFPYQVNGDIVPIDVSVWNIGGANASNVKVKARVKVPLFPDTATIGTINIPLIPSKDSAAVRFMWDPTVYKFDNGQQIVLPDGYYGVIGESKFFFIADPNSEITESWEGNNKTDTINTVAIYPQGWSRKCSYLTINPEPGIPVLANIDATGSVEIVYPGLDSLYIIKSDGQNYPNWPKYFHEVYGIVLADLDNNSFSDIVAVSEESLRVYMNYNGLLTFAWSTIAPDGKYAGLPAIGRIQLGMGFKDIVQLTRPRIGLPSSIKVLVYDYDGNSPIYVWTTAAQTSSNFNAGPSIENVHVSGNREVVVSCYGVYPLDNTTEIFNADGLHQVLNYGRQQVTPALAQINADFIPDVLAGASGSVLHAYDAYNNQEIWQTSSGSGGIFNSPAIGDIHRDYQGNEITCDRSLPSGISRIRLFEHAFGSDISPYPILVSNSISTSPALAKLEGSLDRYADIIFGSTNYRLYAVNYNTDTIPPFVLPVFGIPNSPVIGDIDGDHKSETVFSSSDGYLHVWKNVNSYVSTYQLEWPQFHHDYQRTGLYNWVGGLAGGDANPSEFSTSTTISLTLLEQSLLNVRIYDVKGNIVKTLIDQSLPAGIYNPTWDGRDNNFAFLPNGVYFIEIMVANESMIIPIMIKR